MMCAPVRASFTCLFGLATLGVEGFLVRAARAEEPPAAASQEEAPPNLADRPSTPASPPSPAPSFDAHGAMAGPPVNPSAQRSDAPLDVVVSGSAFDPAATEARTTLNREFLDRVRSSRPGMKGSVTRSFEGVGEIVPGARSDLYGLSLSGASSPENIYAVDGIPVGSPTFGILTLPLSVDFLDEIRISSSGFMPDAGRALGGLIDARTMVPKDRWRGFARLSWVPGALEGSSPALIRAGTTISTEEELSGIYQLSAHAGGPLLPGKLWTQVGALVGVGRWTLERNLNHLRVSEEGSVLTRGRLEQTDPIPGTLQSFTALERSIQYLGKLVWAPEKDTTLTFMVLGGYRVSGDNDNFGVDNQTGQLQTGNLIGTPSSLANAFTDWQNLVLARYETLLEASKLRLDTSLAWQHERAAVLPPDGSEPGSGEGQSRSAQVSWRRTTPGYHGISDFEAVPVGECDPPGTSVASLCPVNEYVSGGSGLISDSSMDRIQSRTKLSRSLEGWGQHIVKGGLDAEWGRLNRKEAYGGRRIFEESTDGTVFYDYDQFGFLTGPDRAVIQDASVSTSHSFLVGGFLQDQWDVGAGVTIHLGLRYDAQLLFGESGLGLALPNQVSPRVGLAYDFLRNRKSKLYGSIARYYETIPLTTMDRLFGSESEVWARHDATGCDPRLEAQQNGACQSDANRLDFQPSFYPSRKWEVFRADRLPVDPDIEPQSLDELTAGAEVEVWDRLRLGVRYVHRQQHRVIEDMSRDEGQTFFLGNPGYGIASDFPKAKRDYDAGTIYAEKQLGSDWLFVASYTIATLRGNYAGLFQPETQELDPNLNSDFDLPSLLVNREGPLPGDHTHDLKFSGARDFHVGNQVITPAASWRSTSGEPFSYLGAHPRYGPDQVYIIPRGEGGRLPWHHSLDAHLTYTIPFGEDVSLSVLADVFNVLNFQAVTSIEESFTRAEVRPIRDGKVRDIDGLKYVSGDGFRAKDVNPNFGRATAYQPPRMFQFGARVTF